MALLIHQFRCLDDNYGFLVHDVASGETACIDTPDPAVILAEAQKVGWTISTILNTHWHHDHAGGNEEIRRITGARVMGPEEVTRITPVDVIVSPGDHVALGGTRFEVIDCSGHTHGHIAFHAVDENVVFVGDALFPLGCGRVFEGTMAQAWASLSRLAALPGDTRVYAAHEYSSSNARFTLSIEREGPSAERAREMLALDDADWVTVPTTIALERHSNPFLRPRALAVAADIPSDAEAFAELRRLKDGFAG